MLYLTGSIPKSPEMVAALRANPVGVMMQPGIGYSRDNVATWQWAADNGCFAAKWDAGKWLAWLRRMAGVPGCLFAVVPDVVGDHAATMARWAEWSPVVRSLGYPLAFVAQNGCGPDDVPWDECDAVFLGGDDTYKLGPDAEAVARRAKALGKWLHMGRVNSLRRLRIAADWGCDSADGTFLAFGPDVNTPRLTGWLMALRDRPSLFQVA